MAKLSIYKFYCCYAHTIDGKLGTVQEFPAASDSYAQGVASAEFRKDENSHYGLLVKTDGRNETIVCTYEHKIM